MVGQCHGQQTHLGERACATVATVATESNQTSEHSGVLWMLLAGHHLYIYVLAAKALQQQVLAAKLLSGICLFAARGTLQQSEREREREPFASLPTVCNLCLQSTCNTALTAVLCQKARAMIEREYQAICWGHFCFASCVSLQCAAFSHDHCIESIRFYMILYNSILFQIFCIYTI